MSGTADYEPIYDLVRRIPEGFVTTYKDVTPGAPRLAGRALAQVPDGVPWWRVVRADGSLAVGEEQKARLQEEGVPFRGSRVILRDVRLPHEALEQLDPAEPRASPAAGRATPR